MSMCVSVRASASHFCPEFHSASVRNERRSSQKIVIVMHECGMNDRRDKRKKERESKRADTAVNGHYSIAAAAAGMMSSVYVRQKHDAIIASYIVIEDRPHARKFARVSFYSGHLASSSHQPAHEERHHTDSRDTPAAIHMRQTLWLLVICLGSLHDCNFNQNAARDGNRDGFSNQISVKLPVNEFTLNLVEIEKLIK